MRSLWLTVFHEFEAARIVASRLKNAQTDIQCSSLPAKWLTLLWSESTLLSMDKMDGQIYFWHSSLKLFASPSSQHTQLRRWEWAAKLVGGLASYVPWIPVEKGGNWRDLAGEIPSFKMLGSWQAISMSFEFYIDYHDVKTQKIIIMIISFWYNV